MKLTDKKKIVSLAESGNSPGWVLPSNTLMGMWRWMGSHLSIDYDGVAFSIELLEWGRTFSGFWGKKILASSDLKMGRFAVKMGSAIGHRIDYNGVGVLRGQRHIACKN